MPGFVHGATERAGHEYELTDRALEEGFGTIVAVGGDGTWSHVADRIVASGRDDVRFAVLPSGTGNDFGRSLGVAYDDPEAAVRMIAGGGSVRVDVGRVITPSVAGVPGKAAAGEGEARSRHFLNLVGFGFDIAVIDAAAGARFLKGELLYKLTALQQLFRFPGLELELADGEGGRRAGRHLMLTVSNGRYFGGGFPIAPTADIRDGLLHACRISDAPPFTRMNLFNRAGKGRHVESDRVEVISSGRFAVQAERPPRFEIDGDVFVSTERRVEVEILPGRLRVATA